MLCGNAEPARRRTTGTAPCVQQPPEQQLGHGSNLREFSPTAAQSGGSARVSQDLDQSRKVTLSLAGHVAGRLRTLLERGHVVRGCAINGWTACP
jgi:hypothetical protein